MKNGLIIDYNSIAARLANDDDNVQSEFIKTFIKELKNCCETEHNTNMQLAFINTKLTEDEKELIKMLSYTEAV